MIRRSTVFLADPQSLFCELMAQSLSDSFDVIGAAHDGPSTVKEVVRLKPDVVILDIFMPLLNGLDVATRIRESAPATRVIFLTVHYDPGVARRALSTGALGFLLKSSAASELPAAIWSVLRGNRHVTPAVAELIGDGCYEDEEGAEMTAREREVVQLLAEGRAMKQVADVLNVSTRTIAFHKYRVMRKLGLSSSAELVRLAVSQGLVAGSPEGHPLPGIFPSEMNGLRFRTA